MRQQKQTRQHCQPHQNGSFPHHCSLFAIGPGARDSIARMASALSPGKTTDADTFTGQPCKPRYPGRLTVHRLAGDGGELWMVGFLFMAWCGSFLFNNNPDASRQKGGCPIECDGKEGLRKISNKRQVGSQPLFHFLLT